MQLEAIWRTEGPRLVAGLTRLVRDVGLAEELAQDALVAALEQWPREGRPDNPGAWLMATAKHRALDHLRRRKLVDDKHEVMARSSNEASQFDVEARLDEHVGDDLLRLMFISCHPVLSPEGRVALTLRLLGGLTTTEISRAFLQPEATIAQRIVRAKKTLAEAQVPFELPRGPELEARLGAVLEVLYLVFNEGYSATAGDDVLRPALCAEALRLGRSLVTLMPGQAEVHGLVALMALQASRARARVTADGTPVPLLEQDRSQWDQRLISEGLTALAQAQMLGGVDRPYALQAAIAACHARASTAIATEWGRIAALYSVLARISPSPVVELNRAVAVSMALGPAAALPLLDALSDEPALARYHLFPAVRGDLLARLGRHAEALDEFERAASLTRNERERLLLLGRAGQMRDAQVNPGLAARPVQPPGES